MIGKKFSSFSFFSGFAVAWTQPSAVAGFLSPRVVTVPITSSTRIEASRRSFICQGIQVAVASAAGLAAAPLQGSAASQARVAQYPPLEYLEPVYELKLSVQALSQAAGDTSKYSILKQRLDKFFGGGIVSERNYYAGLGLQYTGKIQYDPNELKEYIQLDKESRIMAMEDTLNSLKDLLDQIKQDSPNPSQVQAYANQAKTSLDRWFALVPPSDVDSVANLFVTVRKADANRNGTLEPDELATLPEDMRAIWKRRIEYVGG